MTGQHELRDANIRRVVEFGLGLSLLVALAMLAMWLLFRYLAGLGGAGIKPSSAVEIEEPVPRPLLQVTPGADLHAKRRVESQMLNSYRWVDKDSGLVAIPIEHAMDLIAAKGLGRRPEPEGGR